jgi:hypothetical protein
MTSLRLENLLHVIHIWPPLWSSGQSSWLHIQRSGLDSRRYQIFWGVVGLEWGPLSLVSTIEELLGRKSSGSYTTEQHSETSSNTIVGVSPPSGHRRGNCVVSHDFALRAAYRDSDNGPFSLHFRVPRRDTQVGSSDWARGTASQRKGEAGV